MVKLFARLDDNGNIVNENFHRGLEYNGELYGYGVSDEYFYSRGWLPIISYPVPKIGTDVPLGNDIITKLVLSDDKKSIHKAFVYYEKFNPSNFEVTSFTDTKISDSLYKRVNTLSPIRPDVDILADEKSVIIKWIQDNYIGANLEKLVENYPQTERITWGAQLEEAEKYLNDNTYVPALLNEISTARNIPLTELAQMIIDKNKVYRQESGAILGKGRALMDSIETTTTTSEIKSLFTQEFPDFEYPIRF